MTWHPLRVMDPEASLKDYLAEVGVPYPGPYVLMDENNVVKRISQELGQELIPETCYLEQLWLRVDPGGAPDEGGGGGTGPDWVPAGATIHIDLVGGTSQARGWVDGTGEVAFSSLFGSDSIMVYDPAKHTTNGYEGHAEAALIGAAKAALIDPAGAVLVIDSTVTNQVQMELCSFPGFATDGIYFRGDVNSGISDGNGGGYSNTESGVSGRGKAAYLVSSAVQQASDNGGTVVTCTPSVKRPVEPNLAEIIIQAGSILHAITLYPVGTDLQEVSASLAAFASSSVSSRSISGGAI